MVTVIVFVIFPIQLIVVLIDKLLKTQIVECSAVANWIFSDEMMQDFTRYFYQDLTS